MRYRRAHRAMLGLLILGASVGGCRAVLGITDLSVDTDGVDGGPDTSTGGGADTGAGVDGSRVDAGGAGNDAVADVVQAPDAKHPCADSGTECGKCCRMGHNTAMGELERLGRDAGCLCGPTGPCASSCSGSGAICSSTPNPGGGSPPPCGQCVDQQLLFPGAPCTAAVDACNRSTVTCKPLIDCFRDCP